MYSLSPESRIGGMNNSGFNLAIASGKDGGYRMRERRVTTGATSASLLLVLCGQIGLAQEIATNSPALATPAEEAVVHMQKIVVTATRMERSRSHVPASVTILEQSALRSSPASDADQLLRTASGVSVVRGYGLGYDIPSQINMRGVPGIHGVLLLADGTPLNEAATGFLGVNEIPMNAIERIEAVRGPFSALYGADAFAGVVELFTLDPYGPPLREGAVRLGNEGFREVWGNVRGQAGGVGLVISADTRTIDNYVAHDTITESLWNPDTQRYIETETRAEHYDYRDMRLLAKAAMDVGESSRLVAIGRLFDSELGYGRTDLAPLPYAADSDTANQSGLVGLRLSSELSERLTTVMRASWRRQTRRLWGLSYSHEASGVPVFVPSYSRTVADEWRGEGLVSLRLGRHTLTPGVDLTAVNAEFGPTENTATGSALPSSSGRHADRTHVGLYLQDEWAVTERLTATAGGRVDTDSGYGEVVSPRGGLVFRATEDTTLRASAGRAYRAPSLLELRQPDVAFGNMTFRSNPDLEPEYIMSVDAGVEQRLGNACRLQFTAFYNDMDDLISRRSAGQVVTFENVDEAWSAGVEALAEYTVAEAASVVVSYTRQESEDRHTGLDLAYAPNDTVGFGVRSRQRVRHLQIEGSISELYVGERGYEDTSTGLWRELNGYWRTDAVVRGTFGQNVWIGLGAENLTDELYQESSTLNPAPGRLWHVEVGGRL